MRSQGIMMSIQCSGRQGTSSLGITVSAVWYQTFLSNEGQAMPTPQIPEYLMICYLVRLFASWFPSDKLVCVN